jgi:hypothetical protein
MLIGIGRHPGMREDSSFNFTSVIISSPLSINDVYAEKILLKGKSVLRRV